MAIGLNKVISVNYTLKDSEGEIIDSTENSSPFSFLSGNGQVIPKLEEQVSTMIIGSKKNIKISAADAYGEYDEKAVQQVNKDQFADEANIEVGMNFVASSPDGKHMPFTITEIADENVTIDFNHPLAGKDLEFDVELLDVRDATPEEISHGHVHGPGGHHH